MKLIQESKECPADEIWMRFHSNRKDFKYSGKTPLEFHMFLKNLDQKYCFFWMSLSVNRAMFYLEI